MADVEMVGCHHQLNAHESEQTPGNSEGQGSLACCCPQHLSRTQLSNCNNNNPQKDIPVKIKKLILSFMWKDKGAKLDKIILKKKTKGRRILQ